MLDSVGAGDALTCDLRVRAVGTDHAPGPDPPRRPRPAGLLRPVLDRGHTVRLAHQPLEGPGAPFGAGGAGSLAQPLVEHLPINHPNIATLDRDVHPAVRRRDHARAGDPRDEQVIGNGVVPNEPRRHRPTAWLDAAGPVEEQHRPPGPGKDCGSRRSGRTAAHHHRVELLVWHGAHRPPRPAALTAPTAVIEIRRAAGWPIRAASAAERMNSAAWAAKTVP
jgi:hypothetical protein